MAKILVVEDDQDLARRLKQMLTREQHLVDLVHDGQEGLERLRYHEYELAILDWQMPGLSGVEVCKEYRAGGGDIPVLMLTGKQEVRDKTEGLDAGADDYLVKPFALEELTARIRALLRRKPAVVGTQLECAGLLLDSVCHRVNFQGKDIDLLPRELSLLEFFMRHPNEVFSPEALLERVWSSESESSIYSVYTCIKTLRKRLSAAGAADTLINNVYGRGYKLDTKTDS